MVIGVTEHLYTQLVTTSNYNRLIGLHTLKITVIAAHIKYPVFSSRFLATDPNNVLCERPYRLANIAQQSHCSNCLLSGWRPSRTNLPLFSSLTAAPNLSRLYISARTAKKTPRLIDVVQSLQCKHVYL
jgi:hypothetical protein